MTLVFTFTNRDNTSAADEPTPVETEADPTLEPASPRTVAPTSVTAGVVVQSETLPTSSETTATNSGVFVGTENPVPPTLPVPEQILTTTTLPPTTATPTTNQINETTAPTNVTLPPTTQATTTTTERVTTTTTRQTTTTTTRQTTTTTAPAALAIRRVSSDAQSFTYDVASELYCFDTYSYTLVDSNSNVLGSDTKTVRVASGCPRNIQISLAPLDLTAGERYTLAINSLSNEGVAARISDLVTITNS